MISSLEELAKCKGHISLVWNAISVLNKIEEVDRIAILAKPSFIGITESWLNNSIDSLLVRIDGYNIHRADCTLVSGKKGGGGGLLWYYDKQLNCTPLTEYSYCDRNIEMCLLRLNLTRTRAIYMVLIYRPPTGNVGDFLTKIEVATNLRTISLCEINYTGDFNLDLLKKDPKIKEYKTCMK